MLSAKGALGTRARFGRQRSVATRARERCANVFGILRMFSTDIARDLSLRSFRSITTVFSHSQTVVLCGSCAAVLCQPTGGKARLTEGCSFRRKGD